MSSMFLEKDDVEKLTMRKQCAAQVRTLRFTGIRHRIRPDGTVAISRAHVDLRDAVVIDAFSGAHNPISRLGLKARTFRATTRDQELTGLPTAIEVRPCLRLAAQAEKRLNTPNTPPSGQPLNPSLTPEKNGNSDSAVLHK